MREIKGTHRSLLLMIIVASVSFTLTALSKIYGSDWLPYLLLSTGIIASASLALMIAASLERSPLRLRRRSAAAAETAAAYREHLLAMETTASDLGLARPKTFDTLADLIAAHTQGRHRSIALLSGSFGNIEVTVSSIMSGSVLLTHIAAPSAWTGELLAYGSENDLVLLGKENEPSATPIRQESGLTLFLEPESAATAPVVETVRRLMGRKPKKTGLSPVDGRIVARKIDVASGTARLDEYGLIRDAEHLKGLLRDFINLLTLLDGPSGVGR